MTPRMQAEFEAERAAIQAERAELLELVRSAVQEWRRLPFIGPGSTVQVSIERAEAVAASLERALRAEPAPPVLTRQGLLELQRELCSEALVLMAKKNADYAAADPLGNVRRHGCQGIVVRLFDKVSRLETAASRELTVDDETVRDTVLDVINYAVLYLAMAGVLPRPVDAEAGRG